MPRKSAGILAYRSKAHLFEVLLVHPGGPFWKNKDAGAWSIPKGEYADDEEPLKAALREFKEELGIDISGVPLALSPVRQKSGKEIIAFAIESDVDVTNITSNTVTINWPPKSNKQIAVPEVDKAQWFNIIDAAEKINPAQAALIDDLMTKFFSLTDEQLEKIKVLGNIIKHRRLIDFYFESRLNSAKPFKDYRKVEPYFVGLFISGPKKEKLSLTGFFWPTSHQIKTGEEKGQGNYSIDKMDLKKLKILDETYDEIQIPPANIHNTKTMIIFYKTDLKKFVHR